MKSIFHSVPTCFFGSLSSYFQANFRAVRQLTFALCIALLSTGATIASTSTPVWELYAALPEKTVCVAVCEALIDNLQQNHPEKNASILTFLAEYKRTLELLGDLPLMKEAAKVHLIRIYTVTQAASAVPYDEERHQKYVSLWEETQSLILQKRAVEDFLHRLQTVDRALRVKIDIDDAEKDGERALVYHKIREFEEELAVIKSEIIARDRILLSDYRPLYRQGAFYKAIGGFSLVLLSLIAGKAAYTPVKKYVTAHPYATVTGGIITLIAVTIGKFTIQSMLENKSMQTQLAPDSLFSRGENNKGFANKVVEQN